MDTMCFFCWQGLTLLQPCLHFYLFSSKFHCNSLFLMSFSITSIHHFLDLLLFLLFIIIFIAILLLLSAFPFSQGWPQRIIILHILYDHITSHLIAMLEFFLCSSFQCAQTTTVFDF